ncbi:DUF2255 family protein [Pontibacter sp. G13]|uniref:DUF2255 family protein n=1 Tax=Pontibacter sp. G13 TaxID=3074898 RepID=UPI002889C977|nr:DUF2255 family protein [Pontibacter sp. G13]WNJ18173.1 DUF2255 family protein [Pontibacter sp. G13]
MHAIGHRKALHLYARNLDTVGINSGNRFNRFLDIWIVEVEDRIFVRSGGHDPAGWFATFMQDEYGYLLCDQEVIPITGYLPVDLKDMLPRIDQAYWDKYGYGRRIPLVEQITSPASSNWTLEIFPQAS